MFDSNGGNSITDTIVVTNGSVYGTLPTPTKSGSSFVGWNTEADGTGTTITSDSIVNLTEDITLYAIWKNISVIPEFTYTGKYQIVDDNDNVITATTGNWKIRFLESGTLTFTSLNGAENGIDVFLVGGGGGGSASGGGGGYTKTEKNITVDTSTSYSITIGAGGAQSVSGAGYDGSSSSAFGVTAAGGKVGKSGVYGGDGGSGGGGYTAGNGGSDGGNGASGGYAGGTGQGTTTREFGESSGKLYAGGGGGGHGKEGSSVGSGGAANTGGGGGGGIYGDNGCGGAGGSGIVIIRNAR